MKWAVSVASFACGAVAVSNLHAAEWKSEPSLSMSAQYNDNVRLLPDSSDPESSTGYMVEPRIAFKVEEQHLWDMSLDARGRISRNQDVEDADSDSFFFVFDTKRQTELTDWKLNASFRRNSNFDTDFETQNKDSGVLLDDHTEEKISSVSPSVVWNMSETSQLSLLLNTTDVVYDELTNVDYENYDYDSIQLSSYWLMSENHQLGFTSSYAEFESPSADFSYDQTILQLDYTYKLSRVTEISLSLGARRLDSLAENVVLGCEAGGTVFDIQDVSSTGECPATIFIFPATPVLEDVRGVDDGTVVDIGYTSSTETVRQNIKAGRTVIPSSFGGAQERTSLTYLVSIDNTERFSTSLVLDAYETETLSGRGTVNDRSRYRVEPQIRYKLDKNWTLNVKYIYQQQEFEDSSEERSSNTLYMSLYLHWPKLATTY